MSYRTSRLINVDRTRDERSRCTDLVPLPRHACVGCGGPTRTERHGQLPLLRHGGYGAVVETTYRVCDACPLVSVVQRQEVRPPRRATS